MDVACICSCIPITTAIHIAIAGQILPADSSGHEASHMCACQRVLTINVVAAGRCVLHRARELGNEWVYVAASVIWVWS
eukprot:842213-Alexandrium_andersonii.AAC.1